MPNDTKAKTQVGDFGQPRLERLLNQMFARDRVQGSILLEGPPGVGKEALALELGRLLCCESSVRCAPATVFKREGDTRPDSERCSSCRKYLRLQHPDLFVVFPVPREVSEKSDFDTINKILARKAADPYHKPDHFDRPSLIQAEVLRDRVLPMLGRRPVEGRVKTVVLSDADRMAPGIGNLLLKTLEEPPPDSLILLTSAFPERLLPTIHSRCQRLRLAPLAREWMEARLVLLHGASKPQARLAASMTQGNMRAAARGLDGEHQELCDGVFVVIQAAAQGDTLLLLEKAQALTQDPKRHSKLPLFLQMLVLVVRDTLLLSEASDASDPKSPASLVFSDRRKELRSFAEAWDWEALHGFILRAEAAEREIAGYVHTELTLDSLFLQMVTTPEKRPQMTART